MTKMTHFNPPLWNELLKIINLQCILLILFVIGLGHSLKAQSGEEKISLNLKNATMAAFEKEIKKQAGYAFFYKDSVAKVIEPISIVVKNTTLKSILDEVIVKKGFSYIIEDKTVVVRKASKTPQVNLVQITGRVVDEKGNSIPGATVVIHGTTQGVAADFDGHYKLMASPDDVLRVSFIGYKTEIVPIKGKTRVNVILRPTSENIDEVTVVAFGEQKKESVVSSITTVDVKQLKSSSSDLTTQFAGKIPGMIAWQTGGIPGALTEDEMNTKFYIRGITSFQTSANIDPLILIDNVESTKLDLARIAPEDIESFSVLKDASATAMYGARGANGVILVTTKKGEAGSVYTTVRYEAILSQPTREIEVVDPVTYMKMYNEALLSRNPDASPEYDMLDIERRGNKNYPSWVYPANDWYKILFKKHSINHHMGVNVRGGSEIVQYYASVNYNRDEGMLKTDRLNQFDCNITNNAFAFRTNLTVNLNAGIQLLLNTSANLDKYHGPLSDVREAYGLAFNASPVDFAPTYPADEAHDWPHILFGKTETGINPYASIHTGYTERDRYSATVRAEYIHNLSSLVKGLELRASVSLNKTGYYATPLELSPSYYQLVNYDDRTGKHTLTQLNEGRRTLQPSPSGKANQQGMQVAYEVRGLHTAAWKDHQTSLTAVFSAQETTTSQVGMVLDAIPQRNASFSMRGTYGYKNRYFLEASFGYNGSERFDRDHQWGFFPAVGAAWVVSDERFFQEHTANWLSFLKFRLSWGQVGNDGVVSKPRFTHLPLIGYENIRDPRPEKGDMQRPVVVSYPNKKIKWEIAEQVNLGVELKMFNGLFEATADIYQEIRHNILDHRTTLPSTMGLENYQLANVGKARSRGIDLSGKIQHAFNKDFWVILNGTFTYSKAIYKEVEEAIDKPEWQRKKGQEISQSIGYIAEGLFRDEAEIRNSPFQGGDLKPGDIRYRDLNNDGIIDVNDATYIGFPTTPRVIYGFSGNVNYKNFELAFAFQGSGKRGFFVDPAAINPFVNDRAMLKAIYDDHWSENNMKERPFWPRLSTQNISIHNPQEGNTGDVERRMSTYFMRECSFLRCTSIELAYNMPRNLLKKWRLQTIKFYARVNNPFLISNFKIWDVELGGSGFNYPIQRTFSLGLNVSF